VRSFLAELKRRNVYRAAAFYAASAWLLVQIATQVSPYFDLPNVWVRLLIVAVIVGFPFVLAFSWFYEITPQGLKLESEVDRTSSIVRQTGKKLDRMIIAVLCLAVTLLLANLLVRRGDATADSAAPVKSIAVLPFTDLSPAHDQDYFSDGMAEELLNALAQVKDLKVAGRTSSFYFKGKNEDLRAIGKALGVAHILEGSVRRQGDKVRITAQLIQASDDFHLWSQTYDGDLSNVFALQESIAKSITEKLKVVLDGDDKTHLEVPAATHSAEAHEKFLLGHYLLNRRGYDTLQNAATAFKAALTADPDYADAWAGLAQTYALIPEYSVSDPASTKYVDTVPEALDAIDHALKIDPNSTAALLARAYVRCVHQFDWAGAEADYRAVIAANPRDAGARHWYAELLLYQKRWPEAAVQYDASISLDPMTPIFHLSRAIYYWFGLGDRESALRDIDQSLQLAPEFYFLNFNRAMVLVEMHRFDEAMASAKLLPDGEREALVAFVEAMQDPTKKEAAAQAILAHGPGGTNGKPLLLAMLGENDLALTELERLTAAHDPYLVFLWCTPEYEPLHKEPRFQALLRRVNLPFDASAESMRPLSP